MLKMLHRVAIKYTSVFCFIIISFNPLNQVFVFNQFRDKDNNWEYVRNGFNPLNQVFVFN